MDFTVNNEQELLRDGLGKFLTARYDLESSRTAAKTGSGWQPEVWRGFAEELGILGATLPESVGGSGGGAVEAMVIAEELGRALVIEPWVDTVVVAGGLLQRAGGGARTRGAGAHRRRIGRRRPGGQPMPTPVTGGKRCPPRPFAMVSTGCVTGAKTVVVAAPLATHLLIAAARQPTVIAAFAAAHRVRRRRSPARRHGARLPHHRRSPCGRP